MKFIITFLAMFLLACGICYPKIVKEDKKFKIEKAANIEEPLLTDYTWETKDGKEYNIYVTSKEIFFINKISSKTNKPYRYYLPKEAQESLKEQLKKDNMNIKK